MFEFVVVARNIRIPEEQKKTMLREYGRRSLLSEEEKLPPVEILGGKALLLSRSRFEHQGSPTFFENGRFTCVDGYLVSYRLRNNPTTIVKQLHQLLLTDSDRRWLVESFGEFSILHYDGSSLEFLCSKPMTRPLYLRETAGEAVVSNRATLANICKTPRLDVMCLLENVAFDTPIGDRTAFEEVRVLPRGHMARLTYEKGLRLELVRQRSLWAGPERLPTLEEAVEQASHVKDWLVRHLSLLPKQVRLDGRPPFGLSGGKDSRLLLALLVESGLLEYHDGLLTRGNPEDPDVRAAKPIAEHYRLPHNCRTRR
jgi:hypothetical protein